MTAIHHSDHPDKPLIAGQVAFESLEWDPELPDISSPDESPKPVVIKPQPVTYTTVGSLVNPEAIPQFATPNRIQREGANRKPLMSMLANRPFDSVFQSCGSPPPLQFSSSMRYTQQLSRSPSREPSLPSNLELNSSPRNFSLPFASPQDLLTITEQEENILRTQFNGRLPMLSEKKKITPPPLGSDSHQHSMRDIASKDLDGKMAEPTTKLQTRYQGLEKMQTLQRLSRFNNPIQEWARNKLSEFAVTKNKTSQKTSPASSHDSVFLNRSQSYEKPVRFTELEDLKPDHMYPLVNKGQNKIPNHLRGNSSLTPENNTTARSMSFPNRYPQPLTAGPPGQRHMSLSFHPQSMNIQNQQPHSLKPSNYETAPKHQINNFPVRRVPCPHEGAMSWAGHTSSDLVDTLAPEEAAKYYPYAWPTGPNEMTAVHDPTFNALHETYRIDKKYEKLDDWFYYGQKRFALTVTQCETEDANQILSRNSSQKSMSHPKLIAPIKLRQLSVIDMKSKPLSLCVAPMINSLLLTLLEYSKRQTPASHATLSNYVESTTSHLEYSDRRYPTLFAEY